MQTEDTSANTSYHGPHPRLWWSWWLFMLAVLFPISNLSPWCPFWNSDARFHAHFFNPWPSPFQSIPQWNLLPNISTSSYNHYFVSAACLYPLSIHISHICHTIYKFQDCSYLRFYFASSCAYYLWFAWHRCGNRAKSFLKGQIYQAAALWPNPGCAGGQFLYSTVWRKGCHT